MKIGSLLIGTLTAAALITTLATTGTMGAWAPEAPTPTSDGSPCGDVGLKLQYFKAQVDYDNHLNKFMGKYPGVYKHYMDLVRKNAGLKSFEDLRSQLVSEKSAAVEELDKILVLKGNVERFQKLKAAKKTSK